MTEWRWNYKGKKFESIYVRFENCEFIRTGWLGPYGPWTLNLSTNTCGLKVLTASTGEFEVVFESWYLHHSRDEVFQFHRNIRITEEMF